MSEMRRNYKGGRENSPVQPDCERPQAVVLRRPRRGPRPLCKPAIETNQHPRKFTIALSSTTASHSQCTSRRNEKETQPGWATQNPELNFSRAESLKSNCVSTWWLILIEDWYLIPPMLSN